MRKAMIKTDTEIEHFRILQEKVVALLVVKQKAEIDYGDIPDEFKGRENYRAAWEDIRYRKT